MMLNMTSSHGSPSSAWSSSRTAIPLTDWLAITQTSSSPESIAASLNEAESTSSRKLKKPHGNAKRVYPYWKICKVCSTPYPCQTREQTTRNTTCSKACANLLVSAANRGKPNRQASPLLTCPVCEKPFRRSPTKRRGDRNPACSRQCRGVRDADRLREIAGSGRANWTEASTAAHAARMSGPSNPGWNGGVTYSRRRGNYKAIKYVRCPAAYLGMSRKDGYVMEHRLFVAQAMGRLLTRQEVVHHEDHNPTNNALANLSLFRTNREHKLYEAHGSPLPIWSGSSLSSTTESHGA